jgi:hypothetical protein
MQLTQPFEASQQSAPLQRMHPRHFMQLDPQSLKLHLQPSVEKQLQHFDMHSPMVPAMHSKASFTQSPKNTSPTMKSGRQTMQTVTRQVLCRQLFCG